MVRLTATFFDDEANMFKEFGSSLQDLMQTTANAIGDVPTIFRRDDRPVSYDMLFKDPRDGCARFDDVWGG